MKKVVDVWYAAKTAGVFFFTSVGCGFILSLAFAPPRAFEAIVIVIAVIALVIAIYVYGKIAGGLVYDEETGEIEIPGSDTDMSLFDMITLKTLRQFLVRERISIDEIHGLNNHHVEGYNRFTERPSITWVLIVSGDFGSRQIRFASKAKRDEARVFIRRLIEDFEEDTQFDNVEYA